MVDLAPWINLGLVIAGVLFIIWVARNLDDPDE